MARITSLYSMVLMFSVVQCVSAGALKDFMDVLLNKRYGFPGCEYSCRSGGGCIPEMLMCNGYPECWDGSDEDLEKCQQENLCLFTCVLSSPDWYKEKDKWKKVMCIKKYHLCNGSPDCDDRSDEAVETCQKHDKCKLRCIVRHVHSYQEYDQCLEETRICNRQVDCEDKSDEKHEACVIMGREDRECELLCPGENEFLCVRSRRFCDEYNDCPDTKADELLEQCNRRQKKSYDLLGELLNRLD